MYDDCDCYASERDTLIALIRAAGDLRDQTGGLILLAAEVRDGWRRVRPGLLGELLIQTDRLCGDLGRLVERLQKTDVSGSPG